MRDFDRHLAYLREKCKSAVASVIFETVEDAKPKLHDFLQTLIEDGHINEYKLLVCVPQKVVFGLTIFEGVNTYNIEITYDITGREVDDKARLYNAYEYAMSIL